MTQWSEQLRQARTQARLSQQALAERLGFSEKTVRNYQSGRVAPDHARLVQIARTLNLDAEKTNHIFTAAGFEPEPAGPLARIAARRIPTPFLAQELATYPRPCLVMNERYEIVAWNRPATLVAELDFARDLRTPFERNLMRIAAMPDFFDGRVVNWDEIISVLLGLYKHNRVNIEQPEEEPRYLAHLVHEIGSKFSRALPRLMSLWLSAPPYEDGKRVTFPAVWRVNDGTTLRFNCILYPWNDFDALWAFDWFPADATTWQWLGEREDQAATELPHEALGNADGHREMLRKAFADVDEEHG